MEVVDERLVPRDWFERIAVREREHRLTRRLAGIRARVEIDAHLLHGSGRRVVQREILHVLRILFALRHADSDGEPPFRIFPVPHVAQIRVLLASEEERVRRRERGQRAAVGLGHDEPILRLHARERLVNDTAELVSLRMAAGVAPGDARREVGRESLQARVVLVRNPLLAGLRRRIHPQKVGALVNREL